MRKPSVWIYKNAKGEIYIVRVVEGQYVTEIPVYNSNEKAVRKAMRQLYRGCTFTVVEILP